MRLHVLDGTYELFRSHFGAPPRDAPDGREVGAVFGLIQSTLALLDQPGVTHVAAATDTVIRSFRNDLYPGYKTEEGVDAALLAQFPLAERAFEALGVTVWGMLEFEADDAMATAAARFADDFEQVVLLSPDKDLAQCVVGEHVVTHDRRRGITCDEQGVWEKFGVGPSSMADYLALVGDSADGFPGVRGWGAKAASTLLREYEHIEAIPLDERQWTTTVRGAARLAEQLAAQMDDALLFKLLATLRLDAPLGETVADLEWRGVRRGAFLALCDELGFDAVRERPRRWQD
jgi:5'-3' exonuclease